MRDYTNLQWPEAPFGAGQRPFGHPSDMVTAFAIEWAPRTSAGPFPVGAATVYLRVRRHGTAYRVGEDTLAVGFRATIIEDPAEVPELLGMVDRALSRARRHATILAGHHLGEDLTRITTLSRLPLRGIAGTLAVWVNRTTKERGLAVMVDTGVEGRETGADLDLPLAPIPTDGPCCAAVARSVLARCLAVGLTAAVHAGRYRWEGTFRAHHAIDRAAWDVLGGTVETDTTTGVSDTAGQPVAPATT